MALSDISPQCQATLDSWCNDPSHCPHAATHGRLHARFDRATMNPASAWRCYAEDTLSPGLRSYSHGYAYCTRQSGLQEIYIECLGTTMGHLVMMTFVPRACDSSSVAWRASRAVA